MTRPRLWQKIDKYKSLEDGRALVAPKHAVEYEAKLVQCVLDIEDDVRRFLPKGTREEKLGIIDNFWREVRANPWDVLKKAGHGSLDLKKFQRQTASFTYVSPSSSRASSPGPATSKKAETSHQESSLRSNRSSPAPTTVSQPPFPLQAQRRPSTSSNLSFSNQRGLGGFPDFIMSAPHTPVMSPRYALQGQSPFLGSLDDSRGEFPNTFVEEFDLTQRNASRPASHQSLSFSDLIRMPAKTQSEKSVKSASRTSQRQSKTDSQEVPRKKLEKLTGIIRNAEDDDKRNRAIRSLKPAFAKAVGVREFDYSQERIFQDFLDRAIKGEKVDVDKFITPAQMDPDEIESLSSENTVNSQTRKVQRPRNSSPKSELNAAALSVIDTASPSQNPTLTWVRTLSTKATSPSPFVGDNASSVFEAPKSLAPVARVSNPRKDDAQSVRSNSTSFSALMRDLSEPPAAQRKDDAKSVSSNSTGLSGILRQLSEPATSVRSQSSGYQSRKSPAAVPLSRKRAFADANSDSGSNFEECSSSGKSSSVSSDNDFIDYLSDAPEPKKRKVTASGVTARTVVRQVAKRKKHSVVSKAKRQRVISRPETGNIPSVSKEALQAKVQDWIEKRPFDSRERNAQALVKQNAIIADIMVNNAGKSIPHPEIYDNNKQQLEDVTFLQLKGVFLRYNKYLDSLKKQYPEQFATISQFDIGARRGDSKSDMFKFISEHGDHPKCITPVGAYNYYKELNPDGPASEPTFYRNLIWDSNLNRLRARAENEKKKYIRKR